MTTINWLNYEQLFAVLRAQGFTSLPIPQGGQFWKHESGAELPLPALDPNEPVRSYHYGAVRAMMSDYNILTRDAFDLALIQITHRLPTSV